MSATALAAGIAGTAALGTAAFNWWKENQRYKQERADALSDWNRQNAYNSNSAQIARLKSAGLSPNLIYQNGGALSPAEPLDHPSYQNTPMDSSLSQQLGSMAFQSDSVQAAVDKTRAETLDIVNEQQTKDTPVGKLMGASLMNNQEKQYYAQKFGVPVSQLDSLSLRGSKYLADLQNVLHNNKNLDRVNDILKHETNTAENEAARAYIGLYLDAITLNTEAQKHGFPAYIHDDDVLGKYRKEIDYVLQTFLREYKQVKWESTDAKHIFDTFNQSIGAVSGAYRDFRPTKMSDRYKPGNRGNLRDPYSDHHNYYNY